LETELTAAKSEEARAAAEISGAQDAQRVKAEQLQVAITAAEGDLPGEVKVAYRRLVLAYGSGALSAVNGSICSFCYVNIPPQMGVALRGGQVMFCKTCGRLLYPGDTD